MKVYHSLEEFNSVENAVVTTGTFDGVHLGHLEILSRLINVAKETNGESVLVTFHPHPRIVLFPDDQSLRLIQTQAQKIELLDKFGLDHLIIVPFTVEFSRMNATEYVRDVLVNRIGLKKLVIGYDHHFGRNREGNLDQLEELSQVYNFEVEEIPAQILNDVNISSTKIRNALHEGKVEVANKYLGYSYQLSGTVIEGDNRGEGLGFPTANLQIDDKLKLIPKLGVYAVDVEFDGQTERGMMNIGYRPTFYNDEEVSLEVHIIDYSGNLYGKVIKVHFIQYLRDEKKFNDVEELVSQLKEDKIRSLNVS